MKGLCGQMDVSGIIVFHFSGTAFIGTISSFPFASYHAQTCQVQESQHLEGNQNEEITGKWHQRHWRKYPKPISPLHFSVHELVYFLIVYTQWSWIFCDLLLVAQMIGSQRQNVLLFGSPTHHLLNRQNF